MNEWKNKSEIKFQKMKKKIDGTIYVFITQGAACESPIISKYTKDLKYKYGFDSYGSIPKNYLDWDNLFSYGMCGTSGSTNNIKVVYNHCLSYNQIKGRVSLVTRDVFNDLKKKFKVKELSYGFM